MAMTAAKVGSRKGAIRINISRKTSMIGFSAGFLRAHELTPKSCKFVRLGYDPEIRCIGIDFLVKDSGEGECFKLSWSKAGNNASCSVRSLLGHSKLTLDNVAGSYENKKLKGPLTIEGFSKSGFLLGPI